MKKLISIILILLSSAIFGQNREPEGDTRPIKPPKIIGDAPKKNANLYFIRCIMDQTFNDENGKSVYWFQPRKYGTNFEFQEKAVALNRDESEAYYLITCDLKTFTDCKAKVGENAWPMNNRSNGFTAFRIPEKKFIIVCINADRGFGFIEVDAEKYKHKDGFYLPMKLEVPMHLATSRGGRFWRGKTVKINFAKGESIRGYDLYLGKEIDHKTSLVESL